jgi:23S rRNA (guanosine2251-2'-O)-methyltransferase
MQYTMFMYICLLNIRSLYNVGSILRTCAFFGIKNVVLIGYSGIETLPGGARRVHSKIKKTSLDDLKELNILDFFNEDDFLDWVEKNNLDLYSLEQDSSSEPLAKFSLDSYANSAFVVGNEVKGVSKKVLKNSKKILEIHGKGKKNSLNVAISASILINCISNDL